MLLTKHLTDLGQRRPCPQHLCRGRVAQPMSPNARQPGPVTRRAHHPRDSAPVHALAWRGHPQKQRPALATWSATQVRHDRLADIGRQRQHVLAVALAVEQQHPGPPVDVVQDDRSDLAGP